jgi:hypothetical protein
VTQAAERRLSPRFGAETMFLLAVAALLILLEVGRTPALVTLFAAWLLVAAVELVIARRPVRAEYVEAEPAPELERYQPVAGADPYSPHPRDRPALYAAGLEPVHARPAGSGEQGDSRPLGAAPFDEPGPAPERRTPLFDDAPLFDVPAGFDDAPLFDDRVRPLDEPAPSPEEPARPLGEAVPPPERPLLRVVPPPADDEPPTDADAGGDAARGAGP